MEKINLTKQNSVVVTPMESVGITLGTCVTPGSSCNPSPWGFGCGGACPGFGCW